MIHHIIQFSLPLAGAGLGFSFLALEQLDPKKINWTDPNEIMAYGLVLFGVTIGTLAMLLYKRLTNEASGYRQLVEEEAKRGQKMIDALESNQKASEAVVKTMSRCWDGRIFLGQMVRQGRATASEAVESMTGPT